MLRLLAAALLLALGLSACSSSTEPEAASAPEQSEPAGLGDADIVRAEAAVKGELPDAPIWEGMKFKGVVVDDSAICVDRTYREGGGLDGNGGNAGYVLVSFPDVMTGEPQDGTCADVASAPEETTAPPVDVPDDVKDEHGLVTRDDLVDEWPLTVDYAVLACEPKTVGGMDLQIATLTAPDGTEYALNGTAKSHTDVTNIDPIWAADPDIEGLKVGIGPLIDDALALC